MPRVCRCSVGFILKTNQPFPRKARAGATCGRAFVRGQETRHSPTMCCPHDVLPPVPLAPGRGRAGKGAATAATPPAAAGAPGRPLPSAGRGPGLRLRAAEAGAGRERGGARRESAGREGRTRRRWAPLAPEPAAAAARTGRQKFSPQILPAARGRLAEARTSLFALGVFCFFFFPSPPLFFF